MWAFFTTVGKKENVENFTSVTDHRKTNSYLMLER